MGWPFKHLVEAKILAIANAADSRRQEHIEAHRASAKDGALRLWDAGEDTDPIPPFGTALVDRLILDLPYAALLELQALMWVGDGSCRPEVLQAALVHLQGYQNDERTEAREIGCKIHFGDYLRRGLALLMNDWTDDPTLLRLFGHGQARRA
jgi:hypothetical protein